MTPMVSVIIPAYNGDRFIAEAIESVLHQTFTDYEIIVVDDGSTDNTCQVLQPYRNRIRYTYQTHQGVAAARNLGIQQAKGMFIGFLDQDDLFLPDKLERQVTYLEAEPSLGLVHSGWQIIDDQGNLMSQVQPWHGLPVLDLRNWVLWKPIFLGAIIVRRTWLDRSGGFDIQFQQTSDVEMILRLAMMGCTATWLKQATVCYRQHQNNASRQVLQQAVDLEAVLDQVFAQPNLPVTVQALEDQSRYQSLVWSAWRFYYMGYPTHMATYLSKSLQYAHCSSTATILDWINQFQAYSTEYGVGLDVYSMTALEEWKSLIEIQVSRTRPKIGILFSCMSLMC